MQVVEQLVREGGLLKVPDEQWQGKVGALRVLQWCQEHRAWAHAHGGVRSAALALALACAGVEPRVVRRALLGGSREAGLLPPRQHKAYKAALLAVGKQREG